MRHYWARQQVDLMTKGDTWCTCWTAARRNLGLRSVLRAYDRGFIRPRIGASGPRASSTCS